MKIRLNEILTLHQFLIKSQGFNFQISILILSAIIFFRSNRLTFQICCISPESTWFTFRVFVVKILQQMIIDVLVKGPRDAVPVGVHHLKLDIHDERVAQAQRRVYLKMEFYYDTFLLLFHQFKRLPLERSRAGCIWGNFWRSKHPFDSRSYIRRAIAAPSRWLESSERCSSWLVAIHRSYRISTAFEI